MTREEILAKRLALAYERIDELETENAMLQKFRPQCAGHADGGCCTLNAGHEGLCEREEP